MSVPAIENPIGLRGRSQELAALERVLATAREGGSAVLVLRGEAGMGKTALLDHAAGRAEGFRTAVVAGVESEMELPYAGLQQLCAPMLGRLDELPLPQRDALSVAFGLREGRQGEPPSRFLVGLAVLGLLAGAAQDRPLVCLVDDAQWLDDGSVQVLAFVARRLVAESVALIFALRDLDNDHELAGLPELLVGGLGEPDARALLASAVRGPLDPLVRDRIVAEAHGNPMALLRVRRGLAPAELAGGFGLPGGRSMASCLENALHQQFRSLPQDSRRLLLIAAAEPTGDVCLLWRAAGLQGIPAGAAAPAEAAGLVEFGTGVRFHHSLVRSAVYGRAAAPDRRAAHRALAEATDPRLDPDRRAWHRAHAAAAPDESVAVDLERSAGRAHGRRGRCGSRVPAACGGTDTRSRTARHPCAGGRAGRDRRGRGRSGRQHAGCRGGRAARRPAARPARAASSPAGVLAAARRRRTPPAPRRRRPAGTPRRRPGPRHPAGSGRRGDLRGPAE